MKCPNCNIELIELAPGINQCPQCKKFYKEKEEEKVKEKEELEFKDGKWFMAHTAIERKWEIAEKGIIIDKKPKSMLAAVICHSQMLSSDKYIRLSWFKGSSNMHSGMIKITDRYELHNLIEALKIIEKDFDDEFNPIDEEKLLKKINSQFNPENEAKKISKFDGKTCLNCGGIMKKKRTEKYYSCERCGEIVVVLEGNPICDIPTNKMPLIYAKNFPVNYYLPYTGITYKWLMGEWKALVIIYQREDPDKKWLRFYWWYRDLNKYIGSSGLVGTTLSNILSWNAKKGSGSTNIYEKNLIPQIIEALEKCKNEIGWN
ncbi:MAG: hypothetical protein ACTSO2_06840 [Promethearchaeota archaeon]